MGMEVPSYPTLGPSSGSDSPVQNRPHIWLFLIHESEDRDEDSYVKPVVINYVIITVPRDLPNLKPSSR